MKPDSKQMRRVKRLLQADCLRFADAKILNVFLDHISAQLKRKACKSAIASNGKERAK